MGNAPGKLDSVEKKLRKDLNKYDSKLDGIIRSQRRFLSGVEDFFNAIFDIIKLLLGVLDMAVDTGDEILLLIPAGMIFYVAAQLTTIF
jgi:hypothetical protein